MENIAPLLYKTNPSLIRIDQHQITLYKLNSITAIKIAISDQVPFLFMNSFIKVKKDLTNKYINPTPVFTLKNTDDFQITVNIKTNWKPEKIVIKTKGKEYELYTNNATNSFPIFKQYYSHKLTGV